MASDELSVEEFYNRAAAHYEKELKKPLVWNDRLLEQAAVQQVKGKSPEEFANWAANEKAARDAAHAPKAHFTQDPEFISLERALHLRQEQERKALEKKQEQQRLDFGRQPGVTRQQLDENYQRQLRERDAQSKGFKTESDRYIREYQEGRKLRDELREREQQLGHKPEEGLKR